MLVSVLLIRSSAWNHTLGLFSIANFQAGRDPQLRQKVIEIP